MDQETGNTWTIILCGCVYSEDRDVECFMCEGGAG